MALPLRLTPLSPSHSRRAPRQPRRRRRRVRLSRRHRRWPPDPSRPSAATPRRKRATAASSAVAKQPSAALRARHERRSADALDLKSAPRAAAPRATAKTCVGGRGRLELLDSAFERGSRPEARRVVGAQRTQPSAAAAACAPSSAVIVLGAPALLWTLPRFRLRPARHSSQLCDTAHEHQPLRRRRRVRASTQRPSDARSARAGSTERLSRRSSARARPLALVRRSRSSSSSSVSSEMDLEAVEPTGEDCAICLAALSSTCVRTPCGHTYHEACLKAYYFSVAGEQAGRVRCPALPLADRDAAAGRRALRQRPRDRRRAVPRQRPALPPRPRLPLPLARRLRQAAQRPLRPLVE